MWVEYDPLCHSLVSKQWSYFVDTHSVYRTHYIVDTPILYSNTCISVNLCIFILSNYVILNGYTHKIISQKYISIKNHFNLILQFYNSFLTLINNIANSITYVMHVTTSASKHLAERQAKTYSSPPPLDKHTNT